MTISTTNLSFYYGKKAALNKLTIDLKSGFNVLLGPNGAGKSTLFSLLTGLSKATEGDIVINGYNLHNQKSQIMASMGVVFQQSTLDLDLSVKQNLLYFASLHGISPKNALNNIESMLTLLNLTERLNDKVRTLNGGHRRRVEIARALIHQPKVLLLDEATVGLDVDSRLLIINHVRQLCQQLGICVLWASHLMDEVQADDNLLIINNGKIQAQGISAELCNNQQVNDVYQLYFSLTQSKEIM